MKKLVGHWGKEFVDMLQNCFETTYWNLLVDISSDIIELAEYWFLRKLSRVYSNSKPGVTKGVKIFISFFCFWCPLCRLLLFSLRHWCAGLFDFYFPLRFQISLRLPIFSSRRHNGFFCFSKSLWNFRNWKIKQSSAVAFLCSFSLLRDCIDIGNLLAISYPLARVSTDLFCAPHRRYNGVGAVDLNCNNSQSWST